MAEVPGPSGELQDAAGLVHGDPSAALRRLSSHLAGPDPGFEVLALAAACHERLGDLEGARRQYERLLSLYGRQLGVCTALGRVQAQRGDLDAALLLFDEVVTQAPRDAGAVFGRANVLRLMGRREEAIDGYRAVLPLHAEYARLALAEVHRQQRALHDLDGARVTGLQLAMVDGGSVEAMALRLSVEHATWPPDPGTRTALAREMGLHYAARHLGSASAIARRRERQVRIGLVSADLWSHPVGYFLQPLLASTAAREVEWRVYANRPLDDDPLTKRLRELCTGWRVIVDQDDAEVARQVRDDGIDVLVDLSGHSAGQRLGVFAHRPAPLQLSWLGYHATTGLPFIDGVIADPVCVPPGEEDLFTEPVLRLPRTRLCFSPMIDAPPVAAAPASVSGRPTFGSFQQLHKLGPQVLEAWGRIATALPEARWILGIAADGESFPSDVERLRRRCEDAGFAPRHLEIRPHMPYADYLAGYAEVDLVLDTFPYPGGTTTAEALWMGVPTLTLSTPGMLGRQGEQLMRAADLPQFVTRSVEEYVGRAVELAGEATSPAWAARRLGMRAHLGNTPLFDAERFGRDWLQVVTDEMPRDTAGAETIRLVVATRETADDFARTALGATIQRYQHPRVQVDLYPSNSVGLPELYNRSIEKAAHDPAVLVFVHDDVDLHQPNWVSHLLLALEEFDVVGVAGNRRRAPGQTSFLFRDEGLERDDSDQLSGAVLHGRRPGPLSVDIYGPPRQHVALLDGVLLAARSTTLIESGVRFDERFDFDFYDVDFCRAVELAGLRMGTWDLPVIHESGGDFTSARWRSSLVRYREKWGEAAPARSTSGGRILFFVPSCSEPIGGVKVIYEFVEALNRLGFPASTYSPPGSRAGDFWGLSTRDTSDWDPQAGDVVVAPEMMESGWLRELRAVGARPWVLVQNWLHTPPSLVAGEVLEGLLVVSDATESFASRCLPGLPRWRVPPAVAARCVRARGEDLTIAYMPRKMPALARFLRSSWTLAHPDLQHVTWLELADMRHDDVLDALDRAHVFVSFQDAEGLGLPALEAMAAGCLVVGFAGVGGREYATSDNGIWVPDSDGPALLEELGSAIRRLATDPSCFDDVRGAARATAARYSQATTDEALRRTFSAIMGTR